jgi:signal transduction histidine kinase
MARRPVTNVFERWTPVWHVFFYVMIAMATGMSFGDLGERGGGARTRVLVLGAVLVAWHVGMLVRLGKTQRQRPRTVLVYLAGAIAIAVALMRVHPVFLMVAMTLYNHVFAFLVMRWAVPAAVVLTAAIAGVLFANSGVSSEWIVVLLLGAGSALVTALFLRATSDESDRRQAIVEELERTREQLAFAERLAGQTEERRRIAGELHDTVTQQLVGIVMHLEATDGKDEKALHLAREGLAEARRIVWAERPAQLESASLSRAIATTAERVAKETGLKIDCNVEEDSDRLPAALQTLVLRAVQEALANIRKHAKAKRVAVSVSVDGGLLAVDVNDDGVGFDGRIPEAPRAQGSGFGLRALAERVSALGGTLSIESEEGKGTTVTIHMPLERKEPR